MKNKKGFFFLTTGMILAVVALAIVLFGGVALTTWLLSVSVWRLAGVILIVFVGLSWLGIGKVRLSDKTIVILMLLGSGLVLLPALSDLFNMPLGILIN